MDYNTYYGSYHEINTQVLKPEEDSMAIRMLVRIVILHQHGQLSENQWKAISALKSHKELIRQSKDLELSAINAKIRLLKEVVKCDISESDLQDLYWRVNVLFLRPGLRLLCRP